MINNLEIGNRIKKRRIELGLTIQQVADDVGLNKSTIQRYENGKIEKVKIPVIRSISETLKVDLMSNVKNENISKKEINQVINASQARTLIETINTIAIHLNEEELNQLGLVLAKILERLEKESEE